MYGYIYLVTDLTNNKIYIGKKTSSVFLAEGYLGSGTLIRGAVKLHGKENFTVDLLEEISEQNADLLDEREIFWISQYNSTNPEIGYNISAGGRENDLNTNRACQNEEELELKRAARPANSKKLKADPYNIFVINKDGKKKYVSKNNLDNYLSDG